MATPWLMAGLGTAFMIISAVLISIEERRYEWTGPILVEVVRRPFFESAIAFLILGVLVMDAGLIIGLYCYCKRLKLMRQRRGK